MLSDTIALFQQVNVDCVNNGGLDVPLTSENIDYYDEQMDNLEFDEVDRQEFIDWLKTQ